MLTETYKRIRQNLQDRHRLRAAYQRVFDTPDGRYVLLHLCRIANVAVPVVPKDINQAFFTEGQRHIVLSILRYVHKDYEAIVKQLEESMKYEGTNVT